MMGKIRCFKCDGKGEIVHIDPVFALFSFGITALMDVADPDECDACHGRGYIEEDE